jgi:hypothetical protein
LDDQARSSARGGEDQGMANLVSIDEAIQRSIYAYVNSKSGFYARAVAAYLPGLAAQLQDDLKAFRWVIVELVENGHSTGKIIARIDADGGVIEHVDTGNKSFVKSPETEQKSLPEHLTTPMSDVPRAISGVDGVTQTLTNDLKTIRDLVLQIGGSTSYAQPGSDEYKAVDAFLSVFDITVHNINDVATAIRKATSGLEGNL